MDADKFTWIPLSASSYIEVPIFTQEGVYEQKVNCVIWGRWCPGTGVLWFENIVCADSPYELLHVTKDARLRFIDALASEIVLRHF